MPSNRAICAAAALALTFVHAEAADAFCRTSLCGAEGVPGQVCTPATGDDCGTPLYWAPACFGVAVQEDGSSRVPLGTAENIFRNAFAAWENATCTNGLHPAIFVDVFEAVTCDQQEYNQTGGNVNVMVFRDEEWPYVGSGNTLALTTVTYDLDTAEIYDADLEVNSTAQVGLTTADDAINYDLASILTHEAGHMLGIAHSSAPASTMTVEYIPGTTELRTLDADDVAAICDAYPPPDLGACDPTPRHGFKDDCGPGPPPETGSCQCRFPGAARAAGWSGELAWLAGVGLLVLRQRRRAHDAHG